MQTSFTWTPCHSAVLGFRDTRFFFFSNYLPLLYIFLFFFFNVSCSLTARTQHCRQQQLQWYGGGSCFVVVPSLRRSWRGCEGHSYWHHYIRDRNMSALTLWHTCGSKFGLRLVDNWASCCACIWSSIPSEPHIGTLTGIRSWYEIMYSAW